ncbi:helix-turn-helix transcriptional regulator [Streptomyces sp. NPDC093252]|uniref:helix-turn-helix domain-containing protein n=1 Tax=Streptomyces sp. NPDC093252 TaxID=3154980 RepID=UPI003445F6EE
MSAREVGKRIAYYRSVHRPPLTQRQVADTAGVALGTIRKIERGERGAGVAVMDAIADALGVDPSELLSDRDAARTRVRDALPSLSHSIAAYDLPDNGPVRPLAALHGAVEEAEGWRLAARYTPIARKLPALLAELLRGYNSALGSRSDWSALVVRAARSADAVAYKFGARDLSARMIELMRWAVPESGDPLLASSVAYVRTETFFAARAHAVGLRALEAAIDASPAPDDVPTAASRGALHMRAAVIAGRAADASAATLHLSEARKLAENVKEDVYLGTAFGPDSVRIHEVSVAVSLGNDHVGRALEVAREWKPPTSLPAERRSGFYIEMARAQLWAGHPDAAFEALKVAREIAPQHTREHPWVRQDAATLRRLKRAGVDDLTAFAEWCAAT